MYPADVDGDGHILMMRVRDETGEWKVSSRDPRAMVRRKPDEDEGAFYRVYVEGFLREHDGGTIKNAPPKWGLDFNRNFPFKWVPEVEQPGAGAFPLSEPETRAVAEFIANHPNISLAFTYHTTGGVILRVPGSHSSKESPRQDIQALIAIGEMGAEETGYPCEPCFEEYYEGGDAYSRGAFDDWLFDHRGILAYTVETWNLEQRSGIHQFPTREKSVQEQEEDYLKMLAWNDRELAGRGFENWRPFNHPQLGEVEIGGWYAKFVLQNVPPKFLEAECHKNTMFIIRAAATLPRLVVDDVKCRALGDGVYEVSAVVKNVGFLPTYGSHKALQLKKAEPVTAELCASGQEGQTREAQSQEDPSQEGPSQEARTEAGCIEVIGKAKQAIGHLDGRSGTTAAFSSWTPRAARDERVRKASWVVKAKPGTEVAIKVKSPRAGCVTETVKLE